MKTTVIFASITGGAICDPHFTLIHPTAEQVEKMSSESSPITRDVQIAIPASLWVLLKLDRQHTRVTVPPESLNWALSCPGLDEHGTPEVHIDKGAIIRDWLDSGAPSKWFGRRPSHEKTVENRQKLARDAAGRFCLATTLTPSAAAPWAKPAQG